MIWLLPYLQAEIAVECILRIEDFQNALEKGELYLSSITMTNQGQKDTVGSTRRIKTAKKIRTETVFLIIISFSCRVYKKLQSNGI